MVNKDIGHAVPSFEFDIKSDGTIAGQGTANYWFNVSAPANLIVTRVSPEAHLDGKMKEIKFTVEGKVEKGMITLTSKATEKLSLMNAGGRSTLNAWNVFGPEHAILRQEKGNNVLQFKGTIKEIGMELEWKAMKEGLAIYEVKTPSPNSSFISTDALQFRARVEGDSALSAGIDWKSEDGKMTPIASGTLDPAELKNNPDYPRESLLKANPPSQPQGRKGKLSYKITASVEDKDRTQQTSILIQQDELDQLRQEYVDMKKNWIPARAGFTQSGGQFNTGDYTWAIVVQGMVEGYQIIAENYSPNPAQINSAYRNPVRNLRVGGVPESQHIYGSAVDIQTVSIDLKGSPNIDDWQKLADVAATAHPVYLEPRKLSGVGHVHVDWRKQ
ncbi:MAG: hypothetical protein HY877_00150 [Deltaproteobacteria bacterium]|nr:hypothetical protein [Deltaproteobacteria bacterium]